VNLAPLAAVLASGRSAAVELPQEWLAALEIAGWSTGRMVDTVVGDPTLSSMLRQPLSPEGLADGGIGLVGDYEFPGGWGERPGLRPTQGWWPEAIRLVDGQAIAYPADADPTPVLAFFVPIERFQPGPLRTIDLMRVTFPIPVLQPPAPPQITPSSDGNCGYRVSYETGYRRVDCSTLNCPGSCARVPMAIDGGRSAVVCEC
jgi:hypothetical protein